MSLLQGNFAMAHVDTTTVFEGARGHFRMQMEYCGQYMESWMHNALYFKTLCFFADDRCSNYSQLA